MKSYISQISWEFSIEMDQTGKLSNSFPTHISSTFVEWNFLNVFLIFSKRTLYHYSTKYTIKHNHQWNNNIVRGTNTVFVNILQYYIIVKLYNKYNIYIDFNLFDVVKFEMVCIVYTSSINIPGMYKKKILFSLKHFSIRAFMLETSFRHL